MLDLISNYALKNGRKFSLSISEYSMCSHAFYEHSHFANYCELMNCCAYVYSKALLYKKPEDNIKLQKISKYVAFKYSELTSLKGKESLNLFTTQLLSKEDSVPMFHMMLQTFVISIDRYYDMLSKSNSTPDMVILMTRKVDFYQL